MGTLLSLIPKPLVYGALGLVVGVAALASIYTSTASTKAAQPSAKPSSSAPSTFSGKGTRPMIKSAAWMMLACVLPLAAGCQATGGASSCDGWRKLTPSAETRDFIIQNDRPFAEQVAGHNTFGARQGCWK